jgi:ferritin
MPAERFVLALNEQVGNEFAAHQQYVAIAVHYDALTLPRLAALFYEQAIEERDHAMMMVQYLLDADADVQIPGIEAPQSSFPDIVEPVRHALEQERTVTRQIERLATIAREEGDLTSEQFLSWFLKEQVEEVAKMSSLLQVVERSKDNPMLAEDFVAREFSGGEAEDPTAPPAAGASD